jgi:hypothetical protein
VFDYGWGYVHVWRRTFCVILVVVDTVFNFALQIFALALRALRAQGLLADDFGRDRLIDTK